MAQMTFDLNKAHEEQFADSCKEVLASSLGAMFEHGLQVQARDSAKEVDLGGIDIYMEVP